MMHDISLPEYFVIPLENGGEAKVSPADFDLVSSYEWRRYDAPHTSYAYAIGESPALAMHVLIMGKRAGYITDHIDHDGLNNTRENLRFATAQQNCWNAKKKRDGKSRYKGVRVRPFELRWESYITINGKKKFLGSFKSEEDAARAYDKAALEHRGPFAHVNFPDEINQDAPDARHDDF